MGMADQVVLLRAGQIEQDAPPAEMYANPATSFAASFIGTPPMNLLTLDGNRVRGTDFVVPGAGGTLGVRPEALRLGETGLPAQVISAEYLGADTVVACMVGEGRVLARLPGKVDLAAGAHIHLSHDRADLHLFDATSGRACPMPN
jgi:sn-glycerol 3-phosphate transport system ATP-binding protein